MVTPPAERACLDHTLCVPASETPKTDTRVPPMRKERLRRSERARLIVEIVDCYRRARKAMRASSIGPAVQALRGEVPFDPTRGTENEILYEAWRLGRAVQLTLRLVPGDTRCLMRSL